MQHEGATWGGQDEDCERPEVAQRKQETKNMAALLPQGGGSEHLAASTEPCAHSHEWDPTSRYCCWKPGPSPLLLLITSIYAVLATDLFAHSHHHLFGNFLRSMWTLFQVRPQGLFVYVSAHQVSFAYL